MLEIKKDIPLAPYTTLKVGGSARFFCEMKDEKDIMEAVKFAEEKKLPVFVLGGGSNILVSDKGFDGLVIKIQDTRYKIQDTKIECGAGCNLGTIVNESVKAGLTGMEWAAGIPGTIGGAVRGNAGAPWGCMADCVESVKFLEIPNSVPNKSSTFSSPDYSSGNSSKSNFESQVSNYKLRECKFSYRDSIFKQNPNLIILSVKLALKKGKKKESEKKIKEILVQRKEKQPMDFPSSGSFFANPATRDQKVINDFEKDTGLKTKENKNLYQDTGSEIKIPVAWLIEECGLKGKKIGGAMVSEKHANFILNTGNATAENFVMLAAIIKTKVRNKFGVQLQEEVQMIGF
jgi:UDP-N-acetylmuramate dehydrogenase